MTRQPSFEQMKAIANLRAGDIIKIRCNGREENCEFVSSKQVNMVCLINDKAYNVPKVCYVDLVKQAEQKGTKQFKIKKGEMFVAKQGDKSLLYTFQEMRGDYIMGISPVSKVQAKIHISMFFDTINSLLKVE